MSDGVKRGKSPQDAAGIMKGDMIFLNGNPHRNINRVEKQTEPPRFFPESIRL